MKRVRLTKLVHLIDENFVPTKRGEKIPTSTNYAGSVVALSDAYADELIAAGKAVEHVAEEGAAPSSEETGRSEVA